MMECELHGVAKSRALMRSERPQVTSVAQKEVVGSPQVSRRGQFLLQPLGLVVRDQAVHQRAELAVHYIRQLMQSQADAVIGDAVLRKIISANFFRAVAGLDLP